jgi:RES domain
LVRISHPPLTIPPDLDPKFFDVGMDITLVRIRKKKYKATDFNRRGPKGRFDHHIEDDPSRSVYYAAPVLESFPKTLTCCIAEVFGELSVISNMHEYNLGFVQVTRGLKLLDLRGAGAMRAGVVAAISATPDREYTQVWSRYFYDNHGTYTRIDGIIYTSAYIGESSIMLYERASDALVMTDDLPLNDPSLRSKIQGIAKELRIAIPPQSWD